MIKLSELAPFGPILFRSGRSSEQTPALCCGRLARLVAISAARKSSLVLGWLTWRFWRRLIKIFVLEALLIFKAFLHLVDVAAVLGKPFSYLH
jgi:hypothetical protein